MKRTVFTDNDTCIKIDEHELDTCIQIDEPSCEYLLTFRLGPSTGGNHAFATLTRLRDDKEVRIDYYGGYKRKGLFTLIGNNSLSNRYLRIDHVAQKPKEALNFFEKIPNATHSLFPTTRFRFEDAFIANWQTIPRLSSEYKGLVATYGAPRQAKRAFDTLRIAYDTDLDANIDNVTNYLLSIIGDTNLSTFPKRINNILSKLADKLATGNPSCYLPMLEEMISAYYKDNNKESVFAENDATRELITTAITLKGVFIREITAQFECIAGPKKNYHGKEYPCQKPIQIPITKEQASIYLKAIVDRKIDPLPFWPTGGKGEKYCNCWTSHYEPTKKAGIDLESHLNDGWTASMIRKYFIDAGALHMGNPLQLFKAASTCNPDCNRRIDDCIEKSHHAKKND